MANQLAANPWVVDTKSASPLYMGTMHNCQIEYVDYTDSHHFVEIQDRDGRILARLKGDDNLHTVRTGRIGWVYGLKVPLTDSDGVANMASGKIILYFE